MCDSIHSSALAMTNKPYQCQEEQSWGRTAAARSKKGLELKIWMQNSSCPAQGRGKTFPRRGMSQKKKTQSVSCPRAKFFFLSWGKVDPFSLGDDVQAHKESRDPSSLSHVRADKAFALSMQLLSRSRGINEQHN